MPYPAKVILQTPISAPGRLAEFVEDCLRDKVELIAIVGPDSGRVEDLIDDIIIGDGSDRGRFVVTSAHVGEPFEAVLEFAADWRPSRDGENRVEVVRL